MKKISFTLLCTALALSLASCGAEGTETETTTESAQTAAAEVTEAETETSAETTTTSIVTTTTTEETTTTVTETEKICTCESDFQHACCEYLNELDYLTGGVYYGDINGDGKPETVVEKNNYEITHILYENDDGIQLLKLETVSCWGEVSYIADTKQIFFTPMRGHTTGTWGYEEHYIYDWNGTDYVVTTTFSRESGYPLTGDDGTVYSDWSDGYINGEFLEHDAFDAKLKEYEKLRDESGYFPIAYIFDREDRPNPEPETYINYIKENFPCFDNWDIMPNAEGIIIGNS